MTVDILIASRDEAIANVIMADMQRMGVSEKYRLVTNEKELVDGIRAYHPSLVLVETCFCGCATTQLLMRLMRMGVSNIAGFGVQPYSPRFIARFIVSGAELGYLNMREGREGFCAALRRVLREEPFIPPDVAEVIDRYSLPSVKNVDLTDREAGIVLLVSEGKDILEIAAELEIRPKTVRNRISHIYLKWNVSNSVQMVRKAIFKGIVSKDEFCEEGSQEKFYLRERGAKYVYQI
jgi:DNA-binding NarL/FixJ family response regulator